MDRFISEYQRKYDVPGVAVVVTNGAEIAFIRGYGSDSIGNPITPATRFPVASVSKSFTALAVMQLVEDGRISLDSAVSLYVPDFRLADTRAREITVRQLLNHTSGMSDMTFPEKSVRTPDSLESAIGLLRTAKLASAPGVRWQYHNPNYWTAARLVEVVSGDDFGAFLRERIFIPLGMAHTETVVSLKQAPDVAHGHVRLFGHPIALPEPKWFLGGCCGIVTTAQDMGRWLILQNSSGFAPSGESLVSEEHLAELHEGLGWNSRMQDGHRVFTHGGILFTFSAGQYVLPDVANGIGIAVMTSTGIGLAPVDGESIADALVAMVEGRAPEFPGPSGLTIDIALAFLCVGTAFLGVLAVKRSRRWAEVRRERPVWRNVIVLLPCFVPVIWLAAYPTVVGSVGGGRDFNWEQSAYMSALLLVWVAVWAFTSLTVVLGRVVFLVKHSKGKRRTLSTAHVR